MEREKEGEEEVEKKGKVIRPAGKRVSRDNTFLPALRSSIITWNTNTGWRNPKRWCTEGPERISPTGPDQLQSFSDVVLRGEGPSPIVNRRTISLERVY